jgi:hypothetical protein
LRDAALADEDGATLNGALATIDSFLVDTPRSHDISIVRTTDEMPAHNG